VKKLSAFILKLLGWQIVGGINPEIKKCVMIIAPHTSLMDFIIGRLAFNVLDIKVKFLIKKEFFFFPLGYFLKASGGLAVDRSKGASIVTQVIRLFSQNDSLVIAITPEGTRKLNYKWERGFYFIALQAKVPIIPGYLDYKEKIAGIGQAFYTTGNFEDDFKVLENFYRGRTAKYPKQFNL